MKKTLSYLRLNFFTILLTVISFMSVTLAWFAYSGISDIGTEVDVRAWHIEFSNKGEAVSKEVIISLSEVYPGMDMLSEVVNIKNYGDSDAFISYQIKSVRILDDPEDSFKLNDNRDNSILMEDAIAHNYPFKFNINLSKNLVLAKGDESQFALTITWPLDSGQDEYDSLWGNRAYKFQKAEVEKQKINTDYEILSPVQVIISLSAEQLIENDTMPDQEYKLGQLKYFDPIKNEFCTELKSGCIETYVLDSNNKVIDQQVKLIPSVKNNYSLSGYENIKNTYNSFVSSWTVDTSELKLKDMLHIVSTDIFNSVMVKDNLSDDLIGFTKYENRVEDIISKSIISDGYFKFQNDFDYFVSNTCYWLKDEYDQDNAFAYEKIDSQQSKFGPKAKSNMCNVIPVIIANK